MLRLFVSDIIKKAERLADLENSDFIGYEEKLSMVNDAYISLYQKVINNAEQLFVKTLEFVGKDAIELPEDFYQISSIVVDRNGYFTPILKRPLNGSINALGYEIVNNELHLYGTNGCNVKVIYHTVPDTLTFPNADIEVDDGDEIVAMNDKFTIRLNDTDLIVKSRKSGKTKAFTGFTNTDGVVIYGNYAVIGPNSSNRIINLKSMNNYYDNGRMKLAMDGKVYTIDTNGNYYNDNNIKVGELPAPTVYVAKGIWYKDFDVVFDMEHTVLINMDETSTTATSVYCTEDELYYTYNGNVYTLSGEVIEVDGFIKNVYIDNTTGYGLLVDEMGDYLLKSYLEDTLLNFPNNLYFQLISYKLAIAFKAKQGADITELLTLYNDAEETFYDTITRDDWGWTRITNVN